jgi:hypothetical protein
MTIDEQFQQQFMRREEVNNLLVLNEEALERNASEKAAFEAERKTLRVEREKLSRSLDQLQSAKTIQTHEQATAEARAKAEATQAEADQLKADLVRQKLEADELLAKLREQAEKKPE